jgi:hypothetical protein
MDGDDTIDELFGEELATVPDHQALDAIEEMDNTVVTSAAPEHDDSPFTDHLIRGGVYFTSGSTSIA